MRAFSKNTVLDNCRKRNKVVMLTLLLGLVFSLVLFLVVRGWEQHQLEKKLEFTVDEYNKAFTATFKSYIHELEIIKFFYLSSENISFSDFQNFTRKLVNDSVVQTIEWVPKVQYEQKAKHEQTFQQYFNTPYLIKDKMVENKFSSVAKRKFYYPSAYINPLQGNELIHGFDHGSEIERSMAIESASDMTQPIATQVVRRFNARKKDNVVLVFFPVYDQRYLSTPDSNKGEKYQSFILGVFNIENIIEKSLKILGSKGLNIEFYDITNPSTNNNMFYSHVSRSTEDKGRLTWFKNYFDSTYLNKVQYTSMLQFANRTWLVKYKPVTKFYMENTLWFAFFILVLGVLFTVFVAYINKTFYEINVQQLNLNKIKTAQLDEIKIAQNTMLDTMASGVIIINSTGIIESFNKSAEKMFGYLSSDVIGKKINVLMEGDISKYHDQYLSKAVDVNDVESSIKGKGVRKDGSTFPIALSVKSMNVNDEIKFTGIVQDVSLRVKNENELIKAKEKAEIANRSKSEFLANMSHELRTPMHAILSFSKFGLVKCEKSERKKIKGYFENINHSGTRLLTLLDSLLDLSKLESSNIKMKFFSVDINSIVISVKDELEGLCIDSGLSIKTNFSDDEILVQCDSEKIGQVIRNLLGNALKFTPRGKVISVLIRKKQMKDVDENEVEYFVDAVQIQVVDEGIGIPDDELGLVFDKFAQSSKTNDGSGGTGLGLAICCEIIEKHHGAIWAENNTVTGATFFMEIPVAQINID